MLEAVEHAVALLSPWQIVSPAQMEGLELVIVLGGEWEEIWRGERQNIWTPIFDFYGTFCIFEI